MDKNNWGNNGFTFYELGIDVLSPENYFLDLGVLSNFKEVIDRILPKNDLISKLKDNLGINGICMPSKLTDGGTLWTIACSPGLTQEYEIFTKAHEETHVLHGINRLDLLQNGMKNLNLDIDLQKVPRYKEAIVQDQEFVANLGGLYALERQGISNQTIYDGLDPLLNLLPEETKGLSRALKEYKRAEVARYVREMRL